MYMHIVTDKNDYPIQPRHINAKRHFWDAFGNNETEISAGYIVRLCQKLGGWVPFTREQIEAFYNEAGHTDFWFNRLRGQRTEDFIVLGEDGKFRVTHEFIARCHKSSPNLPTE